jgi:hypothetical protein
VLVDERLVRRLVLEQVVARRAVQDARGRRRPQTLKALRVGRRQLVEADHVLEGVARVGVRDDERRPDRAAVLDLHAGDAALLDEDLRDRRPQRELAAVSLEGRDERVDEALERPLAVVRPVDEHADELRVGEEGEP